MIPKGVSVEAAAASTLNWLFRKESNCVAEEEEKEKEGDFASVYLLCGCSLWNKWPTFLFLL